MARNEKKVEQTQSKFTKAQLVRSKKFEDSMDILAVVLSDEKSYTVEEATALIEKFKTKEVK